MRNVHSERTGRTNKARVAFKGEESNIDHHVYPVTHGESKQPLLGGKRGNSDSEGAGGGSTGSRSQNSSETMSRF